MHALFFSQLTLASASEGELLLSIVGLSISVKLLQLFPRHTQMLVSQVQPSPIVMTVMISCHWWCTAYKLGNVYNGMYPLCSNTEKVSFILTSPVLSIFIVLHIPPVETTDVFYYLLSFHSVAQLESWVCSLFRVTILLMDSNTFWALSLQNSFRCRTLFHFLNVL